MNEDLSEIFAQHVPLSTRKKVKKIKQIDLNNKSYNNLDVMPSLQRNINKS